MTRFRLLTVLALVVMASAGARAQDAAPAAPPAPLAPKAPPAPLVQVPPPPPAVGAASIVPLKVTITLSKYQGDKKVSSLPYELTVRTDNNKASIRMTTQVPTPSIGSPNPLAIDPGKPAPRIGPYVMKDIGTNIDCNATNLKDGRYSVTVTIEDSSIYEDSERTNLPNGSKVSGASASRTYRTTNALVLRDGQSTEFTTAVDKITGDVFKANVLLTVIK
jgi:hypothetical protein